ncbi:MAG: PilT/PilU family type 4a pilus ATPase [Verrucomicrobia bacterium]|nr:PilT/PilU family type 4a pilus ATPase [Verrucomicrobiota bacterium]
MAYEMNQLLETMFEAGASDLHLQVNEAPALRIHGSLNPIEGEKLTPEDTKALMESIASPSALESFKENGGADFAIAFGDKARLRVSVLRSKGNIGMVLRLIPNELLSLETIGLPESIKNLIARPRGLFLVTGPTGSGKSTTLASMIDWINTNRNDHIITIEDPLEYYHTHKNCIVTQREVGEDVPSFASALRGALRQDPDVILVGEMRDLETIEAAVTAAETGHLVFGTLHTTVAARTVDRIVDAFPSNSKEQIRTQLASSLLAVVSQVLCEKNGGGRIAAFEIMVMTNAISQLIRENKTYRIASDIQTGANKGMVGLDNNLLKLFEDNLISAEVALSKSLAPDDLRSRLVQSGAQLD